MSQENLVQVPQPMLDVFANYGLEVPPLPKNAMPALFPVESELFATGARPAWLVRGTPNSLSFADLDAPETAADGADGGSEETRSPELPSGGGHTDEEPYFLCGFTGRIGLEFFARDFAVLIP